MDHEDSRLPSVEEVAVHRVQPFASIRPLFQEKALFAIVEVIARCEQLGVLRLALHGPVALHQHAPWVDKPRRKIGLGGWIAFDGRRSGLMARRMVPIA